MLDRQIAKEALKPSASDIGADGIPTSKAGDRLAKNDAILDIARQTGNSQMVINLFIEGEEPEVISMDSDAQVLSSIQSATGFTPYWLQS